MIKSNKSIIEILPLKLKSNLLKVVELYPEDEKSMLEVKEHHPGCVYYFVREPGCRLVLDSFEIPCLFIRKEHLFVDFPFDNGEIDLYITSSEIEKKIYTSIALQNLLQFEIKLPSMDFSFE